MKVGISANPHKPLALSLAARAIQHLHGRADVILGAETQSKLRLDLPSAPLEELNADAVVAIGGDGTFLWTLHRIECPLLPINAGTVGFLAETDGAETPMFDAAIDRLVEGRYFVDPRMKLAGKIGDHLLPDATNEVVVHTSHVTKMRLFEISVDGSAVGRIRADGVILATPTGSTSYSLSALGPILEPGVEGIVVSALAPFQAMQRAVVVDPLRTVSVRLVTPEKEGIVVVDGQSETRLAGGASVTVYRSARRARFIRFSPSFFHRLGGKRILPWSNEVADIEGSPRADLRPQRRRTGLPSVRVGSAPTAITRRCLDSALACGRSALPNEFGGILRSDPPGVISELLLLPGTTAGRRHANFQLHMLPVDLGVSGTVHSHPSGALYPSQADVTLFRHWGRRHLIIGTPFGPGSWRAYDGNGNEVPLQVLGTPGGSAHSDLPGCIRPPRPIHRPESLDVPDEDV